jgi:NAD-dependent SIR2 family protein deacetylase
MEWEKEIKRAAAAIERGERLLITAGAGIGVDSGLPDFRGVEGFWRAYPIARKLGLRFEELANPYWFDRDPKLAWAFYGHRLHLYRKTTPHPGFQILRKIPLPRFIFTSNVDGQFQKAGFLEEEIVEIHGSIHYLQCTEPCREEIWENREEVPVDIDSFQALKIPRCIYCGRVARPNILMFGDWKFVPIRVDQQLARFNRWLEEGKGRLVILEIGAGTAVPTVRNLGERLRRELGGVLIRINPREPEGADIPIPAPALPALRRLGELLGIG